MRERKQKSFKEYSIWCTNSIYSKSEPNESEENNRVKNVQDPCDKWVYVQWRWVTGLRGCTINSHGHNNN